jgi:hypothetical protein
MSASIKCPKCGVQHPTGVKVCGCGHDLSVMVSDPPAAPANNAEGGAGGDDQTPDAPEAVLVGLGWLVLIIGGIWYWHHYQAASKREAEEEVQRWERRMNQNLDAGQMRAAAEQAAEHFRKEQARIAELLGH